MQERVEPRLQRRWERLILNLPQLLLSEENVAIKFFTPHNMAETPLKNNFVTEIRMF